MKLTNIDATEHLVDKILHLRIQDFILDAIRPLERKYYRHFYDIQLSTKFPYNKKLPLSPIRKFVKAGYENVGVLLHTIPVYLRDSRPEIRDENSIIDLLGAYYSNRGGDSPYIELYLKAIDDTTNNDNEFKWLFTIVLIHELAHAALDIYNCERYNSISEKVFYHTEFGRWREESMANAVALRIIKEYGRKRFYHYAKDFMLSQDPEYALGVLMENYNEGDFTSIFISKMQGVNENLKHEWLNYVKGSPDWKGLQKWNEVLGHSDSIYYFNGEYYTSTIYLVYAIVKLVLSNYKNKNGKKMSYTEFSSTFPNIYALENYKAYEPVNKVKGNSRYEEKFELQEGTYYLFNFWYTYTLHRFVDKAGVVFIEYSNDK